MFPGGPGPNDLDRRRESGHLSQESFRGAGGALLLTGNALHSDIPPIAAGSGLFGWLMSMLAQDVGFPVPEGGAGRLAESMANRFRAGGGIIRTDVPVTAIRVTGGRATGVECADGTGIAVRRAVLADVSAPRCIGIWSTPATCRPACSGRWTVPLGQRHS